MKALVINTVISSYLIQHNLNDRSWFIFNVKKEFTLLSWRCLMVVPTFFMLCFWDSFPFQKWWGTEDLDLCVYLFYNLLSGIFLFFLLYESSVLTSQRGHGLGAWWHIAGLMYTWTQESEYLSLYYFDLNSVFRCCVALLMPVLAWLTELINMKFFTYVQGP